MEKATYPEKVCREGIMSDQGMGYTCELPMVHPGPCASFSISQTVEARDRWEKEHPEWRKNIGTLDIEV